MSVPFRSCLSMTHQSHISESNHLAVFDDDSVEVCVLCFGWCHRNAVSGLVKMASRVLFG